MIDELCGQNRLRKTFLHLIDHDGTIFNLISPLSKFPEHQIATSFTRPRSHPYETTYKAASDQTILILHGTGNNKPFYSMKNELFKQFKQSYLFLHVAPIHFLLKNRERELAIIAQSVKEYNVGILTPSETLTHEFLKYNLNAIPIQSGIDITCDDFQPKVERKIITTVCTSNDDLYHHIKGIDSFARIVKSLGVEKDSVILGTDAERHGIKSIKLSADGANEYLRRSKAYLQLSRTEAYNLSAVQAKQYKTPVIVSDIEGHKDNVRYGFRADCEETAKELLEIILSGKDESRINLAVEKNCADSSNRETLNNLRNEFNKLEKRSTL